MKKYFIYLSVALLAGFTACNEKEEENKENFSPLTVEQNKAKIEESGITLAQEMKGMEDEPAMDAANNFITLFFDNTSVKKSAEFNQFVGSTPIKALANFKNNGVEGTFNTLKNAALEENPETILDLYNELKGTIEWDAANQEWGFYEGGENIVFLFPATEDGRENNAKMTITYQGRVLDNPFEEGGVLDYPSSLDVVLTVNNQTVMTYNLAVTYNSNDVPTSISTTLTVGTYSFNISASNTDNQKLAAGFTFKNGDTILVKFEVGAEGNWDPDYLEQQFENEDPTGIVNSTNVLFQVVDVKVVGIMDVASMTTKLNEWIADGEPTTFEQEEELAKEVVAELNKSVSLTLRYVADNSIISKAEFGYVVENDDYTGEKRIELTLFFVFGDGSKIDAETYFNTGFEDFIAEVESMFETTEI